MQKAGCKKQKGFSLIEAVMATVVLGIAAAGVLMPFTSGARVRAEGTRRTLASRLAADLMEQIVNTPFDDIVDDFDGYVEPQGQVKDASGVVFTDPIYVNFSRDVSCQYVYVTQETGTDQPNFIEATVQIYYSGAPIATISRLISN